VDESRKVSAENKGVKRIGLRGWDYAVGLRADL
jgi:hypothetical protein